MKKASKKEQSSSKKKSLPLWLNIAAIYLASLILVLTVIFGSFQAAFANQIYPRVNIGGVMVGGLTKERAKQKLSSELKSKAISPVILIVDDGQSFTIKPDEVGADYELDKSVETAYAIGRSNNFFQNLTDKVTTPLLGTDLSASVTVDEGELANTLNDIVTKVNIPEQNAALEIKNGKVTIKPESYGKRIDDRNLKSQVIATFGRGSNEPITLVRKTVEPLIKEADLTEAKAAGEAVIARPLTLANKEQTFTANPSDIGSWLTTKAPEASQKPALTFNEEKVDEYIATIAKKIDIEAQNARLAIVDGKVTSFAVSKDGLKLHRPKTKTAILQTLQARMDNRGTVSTPTPTVVTDTIALEVEVSKPEISSDSIDNLGIKERIAVASSDFSGSPANRQENIKLGTKLFTGVVLKPGEQFSSIKALGRIDEASGFKPELVIKQDQLTPEVGGGLCQVSTTLFRAVLNAGLQVDDRRNHRFRISYYEKKPANPDPEDYVTNNARSLVGVDATIYDPNPDFKFTNDTGNYILIQGKVEGTIVTFDFFGTKDGRKVAIDGPYITGTTPAPKEILYIDDPTLPAGQTKLKEKAVPGAKTTMTYMVTKDGKELHKNVFNSSYVAWQAKYYRGTGAAAPAPTDQVTPAASPPASPAVQGAATEIPASTSPATQ